MEKYIKAHHKVLHHLDVKPASKYPITLKIGTTDLCNHNCPWCSEDLSQKRSIPDVIELVERVAPYVKALIFTGNGESLMHKQTVPGMQRAVELGLEVGLITNGTVFTPDTVEICKDICTWIRISADAVDPEQYAKEHGVKTRMFDKMLDNTMALTGGNATIGMAFFVNDQFDFKAARNLANRLGVDYVQFRNLHGDYSDYSHLIGELGLYKPKTGIELPEGCYAGQFEKIINPAGDVYWCCHFRENPNFHVGNVLTEDPKEVLAKVLEIDTSKCPRYCMHRQLNEVVEGLLKPEDAEHKNFV